MGTRRLVPLQVVGLSRGPVKAHLHLKRGDTEITLVLDSDRMPSTPVEAYAVVRPKASPTRET